AGTRSGGRGTGHVRAPRGGCRGVAGRGTRERGRRGSRRLGRRGAACRTYPGTGRTPPGTGTGRPAQFPSRSRSHLLLTRNAGPGRAPPLGRPRAGRGDRRDRPCRRRTRPAGPWRVGPPGRSPVLGPREAARRLTGGGRRTARPAVG